MKSLVGLSNGWVDNLLNINKKSVIPAKVLLKGKLSKNLSRKIESLCLDVSRISIACLSQIRNNQKPATNQIKGKR
jgi:hypothetical protein